jgi:methyl-accepting chemotaxis protein
MNIREKLLIAPGAAVAFLIVFGITSILALRQAQVSLDDIYTQRFQNFKSSARALDTVAAAHANVYRLFTWMANYNEAKINKAAEEIYASVDAAVAELQGLRGRADLSGEERKLLDASLGHLAKYRKSVAQAIDLATVDPNTGMSAMQTADAAYVTLHASASELVALQDALAKERHSSAATAYRATLITAFVMLVGAIGASLFISLFMARAIVTPLLGAIGTAREIAKGNLTLPIVPQGKDETGQLLQALADMQSGLRDVIGEMTEHAGELARMSGSLSAASRQMASGTTHQSEGAASMAAAVEEMTATISQISNNATDANALVQQSGQLSVRGKESIQRVADAMQRISQSVNEAASNIDTLGQQSEQITAIVNVITEIASQTNLLALNAAIEAARAGEQGRGFAVVADEVRGLAQRTAQSTQEIATMIGAIQENTRRIVTGMSGGVTLVSEGAEIANDAEKTIREIEQGAGRAERSVEEISTALKQQSIASQEIAKHVENIARMAHETSATSRETATSAERMSGLADAAKHAVSRFRL